MRLSLRKGASVFRLTKHTKSEMWGTLRLVAGIEFKSFDGASPDRFRPTYAWANVGHPSLYRSFIWPPKVRGAGSSNIGHCYGFSLRGEYCFHFQGYGGSSCISSGLLSVPLLSLLALRFLRPDQPAGARSFPAGRCFPHRASAARYQWRFHCRCCVRAYHRAQYSR